MFRIRDVHLNLRIVWTVSVNMENGYMLPVYFIYESEIVIR